MIKNTQQQNIYFFLKKVIMVAWGFVFQNRINDVALFITSKYDMMKWGKEKI
jgi:hypothetical protein